MAPGNDSVFGGVDGCKGGWVAIWLALSIDRSQVKVYPAFSDVVSDAKTRAASLVLADIPIGLPDSGGPYARACDLAARRIMGRCAPRVFPAPSRSVLEATDYADACMINREAIGKALSKQTWALVPKIAEVDRILLGCPSLQACIRETHPEVCFAALKRWKPVAASKKTSEGQSQRRSLLKEKVPDCDELVEEAVRRFRGRLEVDDVIDALVAALSARLASGAEFPALPLKGEYDLRGLRMEMVVPAHPPGAGTVT